MFWRCWRKTCWANVTTNLFDPEEENPQIRIIDQEMEHNHDSDVDQIIKKGQVSERRKTENQRQCP